MPVATSLGFQDYQSVYSELQASAANLGGFTINQNYDPEIEDYRRKNTVFWELIPAGNKKPAAAPTIKKIVRDKRPQVGYVNRGDLSGAVQNRKQDLALNLDDPGQDVKAVSAKYRYDFFSHSMHEQQNRPYQDEIAVDTDDLITETWRFLEMELFAGDADENPLAFNGLEKQMTLPEHIREINITGTQPQKIWKTINNMVLRAATDRNVLRKITHIFMTGAAYDALLGELGDEQNRIFAAETEIVPGFNVPSMTTGIGNLPIIQSPYLQDLHNQNGNDILRIYLIDMNAIEWHYVRPYGGRDTADPQIFDITMYLANEPLVTERLLVMFGTLYLKNNGVWRIDIRAPLGSAWNIVNT
jgi:hypothetical protein